MNHLQVFPKAFLGGGSVSQMLPSTETKLYLGRLVDVEIFIFQLLAFLKPA